MSNLNSLIVRSLPSEMNNIASEIEVGIKGLAKSLFFRGKLKQFVIFVFEEEADIRTEMSSELSKYNIDVDVFLTRFKYNIDQELLKNNKNRDLNGLLYILDMEHLSGFLNMFKF